MPAIPSAPPPAPPFRRRPGLLAALGLAACALLPLAGPARAAEDPLPPVKHIWTITLENSEFLTNFGVGQATAPYLARTLPSLGALVQGYYGTGHNSLDNYISQTSGQGANANTKADCENGSVLGGDQGVTFDADGQAIAGAGGGAALGCTFPASVKSLADQLDEHGVTWKGYMEDAAATSSGGRVSCAPDTAGNGPLYARKHDPFVYYHSLTDRPNGFCEAHDVPLGTVSGAPSANAKETLASGPLLQDLASEATTPAYSYLTPNLCNDAHDYVTCPDKMGGLQDASNWLQAIVPAILNSPAYKDGGLLIVTLDEGAGDALACCNEPRGPNLATTEDNGSYVPGARTPATQGGGNIGTVLISPFIKPGTLDTTGQYNQYSYLRSMEDLLHLGPTATIPGSDGLGHLGYAGRNAGAAPVSHYGRDIFTNYDAAAPAMPEAPWATLLPLTGLAMGGLLAAVAVRRRRTQ